MDPNAPRLIYDLGKKKHTLDIYYREFPASTSRGAVFYLRAFCEVSGGTLGVTKHLTPIDVARVIQKRSKFSVAMSCLQALLHVVLSLLWGLKCNNVKCLGELSVTLSTLCEPQSGNDTFISMVVFVHAS
jgi:hypothetical protein